MTITELMINEQIRDKEIRLIDENGEQLGIVSSREAQKIADERKLDLVKIAPQAVPPVCKVLDYGKYRFEQQKKEKEAKKNQKVVEVKETRLSLNIDTNDFNTKLNQTAKFLAAGHKVKVSIRFRGREMAHTSLGEQLLKQFGADCALFFQEAVISPFEIQAEFCEAVVLAGLADGSRLAVPILRTAEDAGRDEDAFAVDGHTAKDGGRAVGLDSFPIDIGQYLESATHDGSF